jgi:hypothetical protein
MKPTSIILVLVDVVREPIEQSTTTTMLLLLFSFPTAETSAQRVYHADHSLSLSFHIIAYTHGIVKVMAQLEKVIKRRKQIVSPWQKGTEYT